MKENKRTMIATTLVCLIPLAAGAILYQKLPETMAIHWGVNGEANGWSSKFSAAFLLPCGLLLLNLLMPLFLAVDPKKQNIDGKMKTVILWIIPVTSLFCSASTLAEGMGVHAFVSVTAPIFVGVLFVLIGNYLPKTKQNYVLGIRLPWTLNSEENWNRTHRLGGFAMVAGGLFMIVLSFFGIRGWNTLLAILFGAVIAVTVLVPCVYSYLLYRKGI